jgi:hypothetical protein
MALLAMLSGLGLPLHAYAQHARAGGPGSDFCTAANAYKSSPGSPDREHATACDMCCGCASAGAASAPAEYVAVVPATFVAINHADLSIRGASHLGVAFPRGPPLLA